MPPVVTRKWLFWVVLIAVALVAWFVLTRPKPSEVPPAVTAPDCPQHQIAIDTGGTTTVNDIPLASDIDDIPEFHDCQRFLANTSTGYGELVAVWAASGLAQAFQQAAREAAASPAQPDETRSAGGATDLARVRWVPVAQMYNFDMTTYAPLHIEPHFNCLYLAKVEPTDEYPDGLRAKIVAHKKNPVKCGGSKSMGDPEVLAGKDLLVKVTPRVPGETLPEVARWDRDLNSGTQYLGIRCDTQWCEVGAAGGFTPSPPMDAVIRNAYLAAFVQAPDGIPATQAEKMRVVYDKGWYDQQHLARKGTKPELSGVTGTLIPHPALDRYMDADAAFDGRWVPAAYVYVDGDYDGKIRLEQGMNTLSLCRQTSTKACPGAPQKSCASTTTGEVWRSIVDRPKSGPDTLCVTFDDTKLVIAEGAARWRWTEKDETTWVRCGNGCCSNN